MIIRLLGSLLSLFFYFFIPFLFYPPPFFFIPFLFDYKCDSSSPPPPLLPLFCLLLYIPPIPSLILILLRFFPLPLVSYLRMFAFPSCFKYQAIEILRCFLLGQHHLDNEQFEGKCKGEAQLSEFMFIYIYSNTIIIFEISVD